MSGPLSDFSVQNKVLKQYRGLSSCVTIPNGIVEIGKDSFRGKNCEKITNISIPDTVTSIGDTAFLECINLREIIMPDSIIHVGRGIFKNCKRISKVKLSKRLKDISDVCFFHCSSLTDIVIPHGVQKIGLKAFCGCSSLRSVTIPKTVSFIDEGAFYNCTNLLEISIPNGITEIQTGAFYGCSSLKNVIIPDSVTEIQNIAFKGCSNLVNVSIPNSVIVIGTGSFMLCNGLQSIEIPNSVTKIMQSAFWGCANLKYVKIPPTAELLYSDYDDDDEDGMWHKGGVFEKCDNLTQIDSSDTWKRTNWQHARCLNSYKSACYIATAIYGSYDCPEVWTLRRFRDNELTKTWHGRLFIRFYYGVGPIAVKFFGNCQWFQRIFRRKLDKIVLRLQSNGYESSPYHDH